MPSERGAATRRWARSRSAQEARRGGSAGRHRSRPAHGSFIGSSPASSSEQRRCDQRRGRYDHSDAVRAAWARGAFDTERYRDTRPRGDWGFDRHGPGNPFHGKQHTPESRRLMSSAAKARSIPGIGSYGDDWTPELRGRVMLRDGHRCQVCGAPDAVLQVHHVDHDRTNNAETNLLTVCAPCHLAYHGRSELQEEMRAAHAALVVRLGTPREAPP